MIRNLKVFALLLWGSFLSGVARVLVNAAIWLQDRAQDQIDRIKILMDGRAEAEKN